MKDRHFVKGTIWNAFGSIMYGVNSFIMLAVVSRISEAEEVGYFGIAFTTAQLLYIVGLLGTSHYQQTDYHEKYSFGDYRRAKLFACTLMIAGGVSVSLLLGFSRVKAIYTGILTLLMMVNAIGDMYQNLFFQNNRLDLSGGALFYRTLWSLAAFVIVAFATKNILPAILIQTVTNIIVTAYYAFRYVPLFSKKSNAEGTVESTKKLVVECLPLFVGLFLMNVVINASKYGIDFLMNDEAQGYYNMIFIPVQVINLCSQFIFKPLLNQYACVLEEGRYKEFYRMMRRQTGLVILFTLVCMLAAYLLGIPVLGAIYGKDISSHRGSLVCVVLGGGIFAIGQLFYYIFVILREQKEIMFVYIVGLLASVVSAYFLIGLIGINGAVWSFVITMGIILVLYVLLLARKLSKRG